MLLLIRCSVLLPLWDFLIVLCFVMRYFVSILVLFHLHGEEGATCLLFFVTAIINII